MKMEQTECSETSAYKIRTPGNYPEENIQHNLMERTSCWTDNFSARRKLPPFNGTWKLLIVFTTAHYWVQRWTKRIQFALFHPVSLRCVLTFRFHAFVFPVVHLFPILSSETSCAFAFGLKRPTCPNQYSSSLGPINIWWRIQLWKQDRRIEKTGKKT